MLQKGVKTEHFFDLFEEMIDLEKKGRKGERYPANWIYGEIVD
jgi:hypothetical protein